MNKLMELRNEKGISQKKLAELMGVAQTTVSAWERGTREPDFETVIKLCRIFKTTLDIMLDTNTEFNIDDSKREELTRKADFTRDFLKLLDSLPPDEMQRLFDVAKIMNPGWDKIKQTFDPGSIDKFLSIDLNAPDTTA